MWDGSWRLLSFRSADFRQSASRGWGSRGGSSAWVRQGNREVALGLRQEGVEAEVTSGLESPRNLEDLGFQEGVTDLPLLPHPDGQIRRRRLSVGMLPLKPRERSSSFCFVLYPLSLVHRVGCLPPDTGHLASEWSSTGQATEGEGPGSRAVGGGRISPDVRASSFLGFRWESRSPFHFSSSRKMRSAPVA